jgi:hypothetical protein
MKWGSVWLAISAVSELALATVGGLIGDVTWLTIGWLIALGVNSAFQIPYSLRDSAPDLAQKTTVKEVIGQ